MPEYQSSGSGIITVNTTSALTWTAWTNLYTTGASTISITSNTVWTAWTNTGTSTGTINIPIHGHVETEEQRVDREEMQRRYRAENAAHMETQKKAKLRARKLLVDCLDPMQRDEYEKKGHFHLYTNGKKYRINQGTHGNVQLIDVTTDEVIGRYCAQPNGVPDEDAMLAQKLYLEMCEEEFLRKANYTPIRRAA